MASMGSLMRCFPRFAPRRLPQPGIAVRSKCEPGPEGNLELLEGGALMIPDARIALKRLPG